MNKKRKFLFNFLDYRTKISKGSYWIAVVEEYIPVTRAIDMISTFIAVKVAVDHKSWYWIGMAALAFIGYKIAWELMRIGIAAIYYKTGMWKAEIDWAAKNVKYNTYNLEMMKTIRGIAEKLGTKDYFNELEEHE